MVQGLKPAGAEARNDDDEFSYNSAISTCEKDQQWERAFSAMDKPGPEAAEIDDINSGDGRPTVRHLGPQRPGRYSELHDSKQRSKAQRIAEKQGVGSTMVQGLKPAGAEARTPPNLVAKQVDNGVDPPRLS